LNREAAQNRSSHEPLQVLVLNASPTHRALFNAALSGDTAVERDAREIEQVVAAGEDGPQVVLVDIGGIEPEAQDANELLRKAIDTYPDAATLLLSDKPSSPLVKDLMRRYRLNGCVISTQKVDSIAAALKLASEGIAVLPAELLDQLRRARSPAVSLQPPRRHGKASGPRFTGRQAEVCELLMEGLSNKAVAYRLGITENTVKNHLRSIMARTGVISRTQLVLALLGSR
jgi:DNA-binding NarL/FixJ family response regulator